MKVDRLIFITPIHPRNAAPIATLSSRVDAHEASRGITDNPLLDDDAFDKLKSGQPITVNTTVAGLKIHGRIVPVIAASHESLQRDKAEARV